MYTTKITIIIANKGLLLFVCGRCHEEGKIGKTSFENTHKRLSINVFYLQFTKNTMKNASNEYHLLVAVHYKNYHDYHLKKLLLFFSGRYN